MRFPVRPELTTASAVHGLSLTTTATVDNSAPFSNHPLALIYRGQSVQINRDTSRQQYEICDRGCFESIHP